MAAGTVVQIFPGGENVLPAGRKGELTGTPRCAQGAQFRCSGLLTWNFSIPPVVAGPVGAHVHASEGGQECQHPGHRHRGRSQHPPAIATHRHHPGECEGQEVRPPPSAPPPQTTWKEFHSIKKYFLNKNHQKNSDKASLEFAFISDPFLRPVVTEIPMKRQT